MSTLFNIAKSPFARERLTFDATALPLTTATFNPTGSVAKPARGALLTVISGALFYSAIPGVTPTNDATVAGIGIPVAANGQILLETFEQVQSFKAIRNGATAAVVEVVYFR